MCRKAQNKHRKGQGTSAREKTQNKRRKGSSAGAWGRPCSPRRLGFALPPPHLRFLIFRPVRLRALRGSVRALPHPSPIPLILSKNLHPRFSIATRTVTLHHSGHEPAQSLPPPPRFSPISAFYFSKNPLRVSVAPCELPLPFSSSLLPSSAVRANLGLFSHFHFLPFGPIDPGEKEGPPPTPPPPWRGKAKPLT